MNLFYSQFKLRVKDINSKHSKTYLIMEAQSSLLNLPDEILTLILTYANSSPTVRQVCSTLQDIDNAIDEARIKTLDTKFPNWQLKPEIVLSNPDVDINTKWLVFKLTGPNYKLLLDSIPDPEILYQLIKSGYKNIDFIMKTATRFGLIDLVVEYSNYIDNIWNNIMDIVGEYFITNFNTNFYNKLAKIAASKGYIDIVILALNHGANNFTKLASFAALNGHISIVQLLINKELVINRVAYSAAIGGHMNIVQLALEHGAVNYDKIAEAALDRNYHEIAEFMIDNYQLNDYDGVASLAACGGFIDIVHASLTLGANNYRSIVSSAALHGHINIVELIADITAYIDYNIVAVNAAEGGHINIVRLALENHANDFNLIALKAAQGGYLNILRLVVNQPGINFNAIANEAAKGGFIEIVELALNHGISVIDDIGYYGAHHGYLDMVLLAIRYGATNFDEIAVEGAKGGYLQIVRLALGCGASNYEDIAVGGTIGGYLEIVKLVIDNVDLDEISYEAYENNYFSILELVASVIGWDGVAIDVTIHRP